MKNMRGRLGNQFFQYAFMRAVQEKYAPKAEIVLSFKHESLKPTRGRETDYLQYFKTRYTRALSLPLSIRQRVVTTALKAVLAFYKFVVRKNYEERREKVEERWQKVLLACNVLWWSNGYHKFDFHRINWRRDVLFYGYFESPKYFDGIRGKLLKELTPQCYKRTEESAMHRMIRGRDSVCLHVRRGDFVGNPRHDVCGKDYYQRAIAKMQEMVEKPLFVVFSDDTKWVRENLDLPDDTIYESGQEWVFEVHYLMRACKHFIISNSTFSWWAQYLSTRSADKIVIAPERWCWWGVNLTTDANMKSWRKQDADVYMNDWYLLKVS